MTAVTVRCTHQVPGMVIDSGRPHSNVRAHGLETAHSLVLHVDSHSCMPNGPHTGARIWETKTTLVCFVFCLLWWLVLWIVFRASSYEQHLGVASRNDSPVEKELTPTVSLTPFSLGFLPLSLFPTTHLLLILCTGSKEPPEAPAHADWWGQH